jgi:hypothetical protein
VAQGLSNAEIAARRDRIVSELGPVPDKGCFIVPGSR